jgi:hypothetical protein
MYPKEIENAQVSAILFLVSLRFTASFVDLFFRLSKIFYQENWCGSVTKDDFL